MKKSVEQKLEEALANVGDMALKARLKAVIQSLEVEKGDRILDCGCGEGFCLKLLNELYPEAKLWGIDCAAGLLKRAKKEAGKKATILQADIFALPFKDGFFDKIVLSEVLEHLENDVKGLEAIKRVLRKNGVLVITVPHANYPFLWDPINKSLETLFGQHIKSGFWAGVWNTHLRLYRPQQLRQVCSRAGLKVERIEGLTHYCFPFNHLFLNGFKRLLVAGILPRQLSLSADKFTWKESQSERRADVVKLGYHFLNLLDSLNSKEEGKATAGRSFVSLVVKAVNSKLRN
jgi:ubiquinone/menaquinone biosynthesis C-methylase UbiE